MEHFQYICYPFILIHDILIFVEEQNIYLRTFFGALSIYNKPIQNLTYSNYVYGYLSMTYVGRHLKITFSALNYLKKIP